VKDIATPPPDYFLDPGYLSTDLSLGVTLNRSGTRIITLSADFLRGLHRAMTEETGEAWFLVLYRCGFIWGQRVALRLERELAGFYGKSLRELDMALFVHLVEGFFAVHGWGRLRFSFARINQGLVEAELENPLYATAVGRSERTVEALVSGLLSSIFSHLSGQELLCHQTECVSLGHPVSRFVLGQAKRLDPVPEWVEQDTPHDEIVRRLVN